MIIKYLGHAGFIVRLHHKLIIMDPWMNDEGAFDSSWFQFPNNHSLTENLTEEINNHNKEDIYVYISHGHKDHFDKVFLSSIDKEIKIIIPNYSSKHFKEEVVNLGFNKIIELIDSEIYYLDAEKKCRLTLFIDDSQLNSDSSILLCDGTSKFLNLNDCKIFDRLKNIKGIENHIDVFTCQFSGASWHPICYKYEKFELKKILRAKRASKFRSVLNALKIIKPSIYFTSAGPACFIDPSLEHLNCMKDGVFPHAYEFIDYLKSQGFDENNISDLMPGDCYDSETLKFTYKVKNRVRNKEEALVLIDELKHKKNFLFQRNELNQYDVKRIFDMMVKELGKKLKEFNSKDRVNSDIYFSLSELSNKYVRLDLNSRIITTTDSLPSENYYWIEVPSWEMERLLLKHINWEDFSLTFRASIERKPDVYDTLINGFLFCEPEDLKNFVEVVERLRRGKERIIVKTQSGQYEIDRYCPHQGADLKHGWPEDSSWICPRHRWCFNLENGGKCESSTDNIHSVRVISLEAES